MSGPTSSPLYALLLDAAAADVDAGVALEILRAHAGEPRGSALALRLLSDVHRLVLAGRAPQLARHYPSAGGREPPRARGLSRGGRAGVRRPARGLASHIMSTPTRQPA